MRNYHLLYRMSTVVYIGFSQPKTGTTTESNWAGHYRRSLRRADKKCEVGEPVNGAGECTRRLPPLTEVK